MGGMNVITIALQLPAIRCQTWRGILCSGTGELTRMNSMSA